MSTKPFTAADYTQTQNELAVMTAEFESNKLIAKRKQEEKEAIRVKTEGIRRAAAAYILVTIAMMEKENQDAMREAEQDQQEIDRMERELLEYTTATPGLDREFWKTQQMLEALGKLDPRSDEDVQFILRVDRQFTGQDPPPSIKKEMLEETASGRKRDREAEPSDNSMERPEKRARVESDICNCKDCGPRRGIHNSS